MTLLFFWVLRQFDKVFQETLIKIIREIALDTYVWQRLPSTISRPRKRAR